MTTDAILDDPGLPASELVDVLLDEHRASPLKLVRAATTANITLSGTQTVDGVVLKAKDRVLTLEQTDQAERRIWVVMHGDWLPSLDADHPDKLPAGTKVTVQEGTTNAGTTWRLETVGTIVLGTTPLSWTADGGGGAGDVVGPASAVSGNVATFNTTTGKLIQDGGTALSALATDAEVTSAISTHAAAVDPHGDRSYADGLFASNDAMLFKGVIDCSANPNYPAASAGHLYKISVAGKIGGASGVNVEVGDTAICAVDGTSSGNQATVGANWYVVQVNLDGAVIGPASSTNLRVAVFSGTTGKLLADGGTLLADLLTSASAAATYAALALPKSTQTTDYTTVLGDAGTIIEGNKATAMTFTIPPNSSVAYPLNTVMEFCQFGAGAITVAAGSGVTFDGGNATTTAQYQSLFARQRATDEWVITGSVQLGEIGYAAITADVTQAAVGNALVAGLSTTVTAPGGRPLRITCSGNLKQSTAGSGVAMTIEEDGTQILEVPFVAGANNEIVPAERSVRRTPAAGLHTYRVRLYATTSGTGTLLCAANNPAFIQVVQL